MKQTVTQKTTQTIPSPAKDQPLPCCLNCDAARVDNRDILRCHAGPPQVVSPSESAAAWPRVPQNEWCRAHKFAEK